MLVCIIIPCYNVELFIEECLSSVHNQTFANIEVIVVDNNSTDRTYSKLLELQQSKYPNLIVLQELKKGACAARNKGLSVSKGEWIQFLDADDLLLPTKIEHQIELLKNQKDIAFVAGAYTTQNSKGENYRTTLIGNNSAFANVFVRQYGNTCSNLFSKLWLDKIIGWDESLTSSQETDVMMRLLFAGGISIIDNEPLTIIREREQGQISHSNPALRWNNIVKNRLGYYYKMKQQYPEEFNKSKSELVSFLVSAIIILGQYDKIAAVSSANQLSFYKRHLLPKYGLTRMSILMIRLIGLLRFIKLRK